MQPFTAQIIFRIECDGAHTDQYEEQWRLVYADDAEKAVVAARQWGADEEGSMIDRHGRTIGWRMLAVKDVQPISLEHGGLLFSVVKEAEPVPAPLWASLPITHEDN